MVLKKILSRGQRLAEEVLHFGRLGKVASKRSFLNKERRKFLVKLGERALELQRSGKLRSSELDRLAQQIEKIEKLLQETDFGGPGGVGFESKKKS